MKPAVIPGGCAAQVNREPDVGEEECATGVESHRHGGASTGRRAMVGCWVASVKAVDAMLNSTSCERTAAPAFGINCLNRDVVRRVGANVCETDKANLLAGRVAIGIQLASRITNGDHLVGLSGLLTKPEAIVIHIRMAVDSPFHIQRTGGGVKGRRNRGCPRGSGNMAAPSITIGVALAYSAVRS